MLRSRGRAFFRACPCCDAPPGAPIWAKPRPDGGLSRRGFVAGAAALGALTAAGGTIAGGTTAVAQAKPHRIDVHHHISPPTWLDAVKAAKFDNPPLNNWSVQKSLDDMDRGGVATAITSPTTPQVAFLG